MSSINKSVAGAFICSFMLTACLKSKPKVDMKTDVRVIQGAEPMKLGEVLEANNAKPAVSFVNRAANKGCKFSRPLGNNSLTNITAYEGRSGAPLFFVKRREGRKDYRDKNSEMITFYSLKRADITDVIVTQTDKPVTLLLTTHSANLWVIHRAPNVEIAAINVISHEGAAVIAPGVDPSKIKILVSPKERRTCWKSPKRHFNAKEQSAIKPANYTRTAKDYKNYRLKETAYLNWLGWARRKIGRIDHNIDRKYGVSAALVGPVPSPRVIATPLGGEVIIDHSRYDEIFWGSKKHALKQFPGRPK